MELPVEKVRRILINVAKGRDRTTHKPGLISYGELFKRFFPQKTWGQAHRKPIVRSILRISADELKHGRPPINELVVPKNRKTPRKDWRVIQNDLKKMCGVVAPYESHREAQKACWKYWGDATWEKLPEDVREMKVEEGQRQDKTVSFRRRNRRIIALRKEKDKYTCQSCGFCLVVEKMRIIDCHHINPIGLIDTVSVTDIEDLVCLCPTCHRVAHTSKYPLPVRELRSLVAQGRSNPSQCS